MIETPREKLLSYMKSEGIEWVVLVPGSNMYYLTGLKLKQSERITLGFLKQNGILSFIAPEVELSHVKSIKCENIFGYTDEMGPETALKKFKKCYGKIETAGVEFGQMRVMELQALDAIGLKNHVDISQGIGVFRMIKNNEEIHLMKQAVNIVEESLAAALPVIKPGVSEMTIAAQLEYEMRRRGSEGTPFGTIVASGYRGALPHGRASDKVIENGDVVILDFGAIYKGYTSDITRTVAVGSISDELRNIYETVKKANQSAIDCIRPGIAAHAVDKTARDVIRRSGYGKYFTHRLGHGIGLSGHEKPFIMPKNDFSLNPGMAFTIEPGIYLPDKGGIRIEDDVIVTEAGCTNLMTFTKDLIIL